jgi:hypothetical protein
VTDLEKFELALRRTLEQHPDVVAPCELLRTLLDEVFFQNRYHSPVAHESLEEARQAAPLPRLDR